MGLAISDDDGNTWEKFSEGPIFSSSYKEPGYIGTINILIENGLWRMWYLSCFDWVKSDVGLEPIYNIKYATSTNGIDWDPKGITCIPLDNDEGGISSTRVIKTKEKYEMGYSIRNKFDYRENPKNSYRIKKSTSNDGIVWDKNHNIDLDVSIENDWESVMVCYPYVIKKENKLIMFYNGNEDNPFLRFGIKNF